MMEESLLNFTQQFSQELEVENAEEWQRYDRFLIAGMGGSALAAQLFSSFRPELDFVIHRDYGLPNLPLERWRDRLIIASSYSGNTEETLSVFEEARMKHMPVAAISTGGKLLEIAKSQDIPFIRLPDLNLRPRLAIGVSFLGLCKLMGDEELYAKTKQLAFELRPKELQEQGKRLAKELIGKIPVIYGSGYAFPIAHQWKIIFNETSRIPAFANIFPELNHNEMAGFDVTEGTKELGSKFHVILLKRDGDLEQVKKRMEVAKSLWKARGLQVSEVRLEERSEVLQIFSAILLGHFTGLALAQHYGTASEKDEMIETFKKRIK